MLMSRASSWQHCSTSGRGSGSCILATNRQRRQISIRSCVASDAAVDQPGQAHLSRRAWLGGTLAAVGTGAVWPARPALGFTSAPPGFRALVDKLDGYSFVYPERWLSVTSSGNDCFLRNPSNIDENLFVDISSPSSSRYESVIDLGTPEDTGKQLLEQYLNKEFMSTRLGIRREGQLLSATRRDTPDGRTYYDVAVRITSFASRNPYVATQAEVLKDYGVEWDRVLLTTLGVANNRLYELRMQTAKDTFATSQPVLDTIAQSFTLKEVEVA
ncbi:hypothetical protein QJQ45_013982 [Haematococcus lacustris]|nr:hypothetical protein QJQ45_013982 [Haematococcus lacustris]